jgi:hypothetical protein
MDLFRWRVARVRDDDVHEGPLTHFSDAVADDRRRSTHAGSGLHFVADADVVGPPRFVPRTHERGPICDRADHTPRIGPGTRPPCSRRINADEARISLVDEVELAAARRAVEAA